MWPYLQYAPYMYISSPLLYQNQMNLNYYQNNPYDKSFEQNLGQVSMLKLQNIRYEQKNSQLKAEELPQCQHKMIGGIISQEDAKKLCISKIKKIWNDFQDIKLLELVEKFGTNWQQISSYFDQKSAIQCSNRYKRISSPFLKRKWTLQEDQLIKNCVDQYGKDWPRFSQYFKERTPKQIRERYLNYLRPNLISKNWSFDEDILLNQLVEEHGKKWKLFQAYFPERSQNSIKNRYYGHIQRLIKLKERELKKQNRKKATKKIKSIEINRLE